MRPHDVRSEKKTSSLAWGRFRSSSLTEHTPVRGQRARPAKPDRQVVTGCGLSAHGIVGIWRTAGLALRWFTSVIAVPASES